MPVGLWDCIVSANAKFFAYKKEREKLAARKKMKWQKIKDDFARKRTRKCA